MPLVDWVKMCPRLEKLTVKYDRMTRLGPVSLFSPGPQLSSLNLDCRLLTDDELAEVLARCTALKELTLERASITREVFGALSGHFELFMAHLDVNTFYNPALDEQDDQPWACRENLRKLHISTIQMSLDASLNDRFMKQLKHLKRLENFITAATYRGDGSTHILYPKDVPGDTPEAQLLTKLCKSRVYVLWPSDVELDPRWKWITDVWPKLLYFNFGSEAADDDDDDHDPGEFYYEYDSDSSDSVYDYDSDYDYDYR
ncbi:hypothetical protein BGZ72_000149 [Mortierella alpina]|nr:hypothetical protein BGZ72_000149 [Mortierella alpina]